MAWRLALAILVSTLVFSTNLIAQVNSIGPSVAELQQKSKAALMQDHSGAVILKRAGQVAVDENGFETSQFYNAIYIISDAAVKDYSKLTSSFNSYYQTKKIDFARVITPDGEILNLQDDAISLAATSSSDDYLDEVKQYEFALPQLKPGSIIEYQVTTQQIKPYIGKHWFSGINFNYVRFLPSKNWLRIDPVLETENTITLPIKTELYIKNHNIDIHPTISKNKKAKTKTYTWRYQNVPKVNIETDMPSLDDQLPSISLSTIKHWSTVNTWFNELYLPTQVTDKNIKALAGKLFTADMSEMEKIKAVFNFMQKDIRYIGAHINRGGYRPHLASEVLKQAYGDCKDQTILIIALLEQANIKAFPAMISTYPGDSFNDKLPMLNFNHMITYINTENGELWLDTSGETGAFPGIYPTIEGKKAFVVNNNEGKIATLAESTADDNLAKLSVNFAFEENKLNVTAKLLLDGYVETNLRNYIQFTPEKLQAVEQIFSPFIYNNRITSYETSDPIDTATPFTITAKFSAIVTLPDDTETFRYSDDYASILKVFTTLSNLPPVSVRKQDYVISQPIKVVVEYNYQAPWQSNEVIVTTPAHNIQHQFFELSHKVVNETDKLQVTSTFILPKQTISVEQYPDFFNKIDFLQKNSSSLFVYKKIPVDNTNFTDDINGQLAQAKQLLEGMEFETALETLKTIIKQNNKNPEAHYLLGLAYGFNGEDKLSEQAFKKASSLGYQL